MRETFFFCCIVAATQVTFQGANGHAHSSQLSALSSGGEEGQHGEEADAVLTERQLRMAWMM